MRYKYPKYWKDHLAQVAKNDHNQEENQYIYCNYEKMRVLFCVIQ